jgi:Divergent InlB B-repeat domain
VSDPSGIDCPTTCDAEFPSGTVVTLRAVRPQTWDISCVGETTECLLVLDDAAGVGAKNAPIPPAQIGVNVTVFGRGAVRGSEIKCGSTFGTLLDCEGSYNRGTTIVLEASPQARARFVGWSGSCSGKKRRCSLIVNAPKEVYATFRRR